MRKRILAPLLILLLVFAASLGVTNLSHPDRQQTITAYAATTLEEEKAFYILSLERAFKEADYSESNWKNVQYKVATWTVTINYSNTVAEVEQNYNSAIADIKATIPTILQEYQTEKIEALTSDYETRRDSGNYSTESLGQLKTIFELGESRIESATSKTDIDTHFNTATSSLAAVKTIAQEQLAASISTYKTQLSNYKNSIIYNYYLLDDADSFSSDTEIKGLVEENNKEKVEYLYGLGITAIEGVLVLNEVPTKYNEVKAGIDAVLTKAQIDALVSLKTEYATYDSIFYSASGRSQLNIAYENGKNAIKTPLADASTALSNATSAMSAIDNLDTEYRKLLTAYKGTKSQDDYEPADWTLLEGKLSDGLSAISYAISTKNNETDAEAAALAELNEYKGLIDTVDTKILRADKATAVSYLNALISSTGAYYIEKYYDDLHSSSNSNNEKGQIQTIILEYTDVDGYINKATSSSQVTTLRTQAENLIKAILNKSQVDLLDAQDKYIGTDRESGKLETFYDLRVAEVLDNSPYYDDEEVLLALGSVYNTANTKIKDFKTSDIPIKTPDNVKAIYEQAAVDMLIIIYMDVTLKVEFGQLMADRDFPNGEAEEEYNQAWITARDSFASITTIAGFNSYIGADFASCPVYAVIDAVYQENLTDFANEQDRLKDVLDKIEAYLKAASDPTNANKPAEWTKSFAYYNTTKHTDIEGIVSNAKTNIGQDTKWADIRLELANAIGLLEAIDTYKEERQAALELFRLTLIDTDFYSDLVAELNDLLESGKTSIGSATETESDINAAYDLAEAALDNVMTREEHVQAWIYPAGGLNNFALNSLDNRFTLTGSEFSDLFPTYPTSTAFYTAIIEAGAAKMYNADNTTDLTAIFNEIYDDIFWVQAITDLAYNYSLIAMNSTTRQNHLKEEFRTALTSMLADKVSYSNTKNQTSSHATYISCVDGSVESFKYELDRFHTLLNSIDGFTAKANAYYAQVLEDLEATLYAFTSENESNDGMKGSYDIYASAMLQMGVWATELSLDSYYDERITYVNNAFGNGYKRDIENLYVNSDSYKDLMDAVVSTANGNAEGIMNGFNYDEFTNPFNTSNLVFHSQEAIRKIYAEIEKFMGIEVTINDIITAVHLIDENESFAGVAKEELRGLVIDFDLALANYKFTTKNSIQAHYASIINHYPEGIARLDAIQSEKNASIDLAYLVNSIDNYKANAISEMNLISNKDTILADLETNLELLITNLNDELEDLIENFSTDKNTDSIKDKYITDGTTGFEALANAELLDILAEMDSASREFTESPDDGVYDIYALGMKEIFKIYANLYLNCYSELLALDVNFDDYFDGVNQGDSVETVINTAISTANTAINSINYNLSLIDSDDESLADVIAEINGTFIVSLKAELGIAINGETDKDLVDGLQTLIDQYLAKFATYIQSKITDLNNYKDTLLLNHFYNTESLELFAEILFEATGDGNDSAYIQAIKNGKTFIAIDEEFGLAKTALDNVAKYKDILKNEIDELVDSLTEGEYFDDTWEAIELLQSTAKDDIDNEVVDSDWYEDESKTTAIKNALDLIKDTATSAISAKKTKEGLIADHKAYLVAYLNAYKYPYQGASDEVKAAVNAIYDPVHEEWVTKLDGATSQADALAIYQDGFEMQSRAQKHYNLISSKESLIDWQDLFEEIDTAVNYIMEQFEIDIYDLTKNATEVYSTAYDAIVANRERNVELTDAYQLEYGGGFDGDGNYINGKILDEFTDRFIFDDSVCYSLEKVGEAVDIATDYSNRIQALEWSTITKSEIDRLYLEAKEKLAEVLTYNQEKTAEFLSIFAGIYGEGRSEGKFYVDGYDLLEKLKLDYVGADNESGLINSLVTSTYEGYITMYFNNGKAAIEAILTKTQILTELNGKIDDLVLELQDLATDFLADFNADCLEILGADNTEEGKGLYDLYSATYEFKANDTVNSTEGVYNIFAKIMVDIRAAYTDRYLDYLLAEAKEDRDVLGATISGPNPITFDEAMDSRYSTGKLSVDSVLSGLDTSALNTRAQIFAILDVGGYQAFYILDSSEKLAEANIGAYRDEFDAYFEQVRDAAAGAIETWFNTWLTGYDTDNSRETVIKEAFAELLDVIETIENMSSQGGTFALIESTKTNGLLAIAKKAYLEYELADYYDEILTRRDFNFDGVDHGISMQAEFEKAQATITNSLDLTALEGADWVSAKSLLDTQYGLVVTAWGEYVQKVYDKFVAEFREGDYDNVAWGEIQTIFLGLDTALKLLTTVRVDDVEDLVEAARDDINDTDSLTDIFLNFFKEQQKEIINAEYLKLLGDASEDSTLKAELEEIYDDAFDEGAWTELSDATNVAEAVYIIDALRNALNSAVSNRAALLQARIDAQAELQNYKQESDFSDDYDNYSIIQTYLEDYIGVSGSIELAESIDDVNALVETAKARIDVLLYIEGEIADLKLLNESYADDEDYSTAGKGEIEVLILGAIALLEDEFDENSATVASIDSIISTLYLNIDEVLTIEGELDEVREIQKTSLDSYLTTEGIVEGDYSETNWLIIMGIISNAKAEIDSVQLGDNAEQEIESIVLNATNAIDAIDTIADEEEAFDAYKETVKNNLDSFIGNLTESDYHATDNEGNNWQAILDIISTAKSDMEEEEITTNTQVDSIYAQAIEDIDLIKTIAQLFADYKEAQKKEIDSYLTDNSILKANYSETNWLVIQGIISNAKAEIESETAKEDIPDIVTNAKTAINGVKTNAQLFTDYKTEQKALITAYVAGLNRNAYNSTDWLVLQGIASTAREDIDDVSVTTYERVEEIYTQAIEDIGNVLTIAQTLANQISNAKGQINSHVSGLTEEHYSANNWLAISGIAQTAKSQIELATTEADINQIRSKAISDINAIDTIAREEEKTFNAYKTTVKNALDSFIGKLTQSDYNNWSAITSIVDTAKTDIDKEEANTTELVDSIYADAIRDINLIKTIAQLFADYKTEQKTSLDSYLTTEGIVEGDYSETNWLAIQGIISNAKSAIDSVQLDDADAEEEIEDIVLNATNAIEAIDTTDEEAEKAFNAYKETVKNNLDSFIGKLTQSDYNNWSDITSIVVTAKTDIDKEETNTTELVDSIYADAIRDINLIKTIAQLLQSHKETRKGDLDDYLLEYNEANYSEINWLTILNKIASAKESMDKAVDETAVNTIYNNTIEAIESVKTSIQDLSDYKTTKSDYLDYYLSELTEGHYSSANWTLITNAINTAKTNIDSKETNLDIDLEVSSTIAYVESILTLQDESDLAVQQLLDYKASKKTELSIYAQAKGEANYSTANWESILGNITLGNTNIDNASTQAEVNTALSNAKLAIDSVATLTSEVVSSLKTAQKTALESAVSELNQDDFTSAQWTSVQDKLNNGKQAIDNALNAVDVMAQYNLALNEIRNIDNQAQLAKVQVVIDAIDDLPAASALEYDDKELVDNVAELYNSLLSSLKEQVTNYSSLTAAQDKIAELGAMASSITVVAPTKTVYEFGSTLDLTGGKVKVTYVDGTEGEVEMTPSMISGYNYNTVGKQMVTITYKGQTAQFEVEVNMPSEDAISNCGSITTGGSNGTLLLLILLSTLALGALFVTKKRTQKTK